MIIKQRVRFDPWSFLRSHAGSGGLPYADTPLFADFTLDARSARVSIEFGYAAGLAEPRTTIRSGKDAAELGRFSYRLLRLDLNIGELMDAASRDADHERLTRIFQSSLARSIKQLMQVAGKIHALNMKVTEHELLNDSIPAWMIDALDDLRERTSYP